MTEHEAIKRVLQGAGYDVKFSDRIYVYEDEEIIESFYLSITLESVVYWLIEKQY